MRFFLNSFCPWIKLIRKTPQNNSVVIYITSYLDKKVFFFFTVQAHLSLVSYWRKIPYNILKLRAKRYLNVYERSNLNTELTSHWFVRLSCESSWFKPCSLWLIAVVQSILHTLQIAVVRLSVLIIVLVIRISCNLEFLGYRIVISI